MLIVMLAWKSRWLTSVNIIIAGRDDVIGYVYDNVAVSAYVYEYVYADEYVNDNDSCYCLCI